MMMMMFITISAETLKLEGETENMCVWTKKRGSMNAVVLMATPCPKACNGFGLTLFNVTEEQCFVISTPRARPGHELIQCIESIANYFLCYNIFWCAP